MTIAPAKEDEPRRLVDDEEHYPVSDGKPMAETEKHRDLMIYFITALMNLYADRPDVQVSGNNFIYYEQGNPKARVSPDCYVVFGVEKRVRDSFMAWREQGHLPGVVFEFTSKKTQREDMQRKRPLYEQVLRIPEYFQFDPTGDYLKPRLQGLRLTEGHYVSIMLQAGLPPGAESVYPPFAADESPIQRLHSEQLGLDLVWQGETLRLYDPTRGEWLLSAGELAQRAVAETQRAQTAETELARLRAELEALRKEQAP